MSQFKFSVFVIVFLAAFLGAGYILYNKQNNSNEYVTPKTEPVTEIPDTKEVKGSEVEVKEGVSITSPDYAKKYTKSQANLHLALNRDNIIWFTNYERVKNNRKPLDTSTALNQSSTTKNNDMLHFQYFEHIRAGNNPIGFDTFIDRQKYEFIKIGENLAMGDFSTSAEVVAAWMKSPAHKKNILDTTYRDIGVTVSRGVMNGKTVFLISQHFGDPRTSCPTINLSTKNEIALIKETIVTLQATINNTQKEISQSNSAFDPNFDTLINGYNALVSNYNSSIGKMSKLVDSYNTQVRKFDQCVQGKK